MTLLSAKKLTLLQGGGVAFAWASLFANGENGVLLPDFTDLTRQFQDSAGTTAVSADGDEVGLELEAHASDGRGVINRLTQTQALSTPQVVGLSRSAAAANDPNTGLPVSKFIPVAVSGVQQAYFGVTAGQFALSFRALQAGYTGLSVALSGGAWASFDLNAGTVAKQVGCTASIVAEANGVFRCSVAGTCANGDVALFAVNQTAYTGADSYGRATYAGDGTSGVYVWAGQFEAGGSVTTYQANGATVGGPGNHLVQTTTTKRPLYKANSGKPYLAPDGTDDALVSPFILTAACTFGLAGRITNASTIMLGGGNTTGNKRAYIGLDASGFLSIGWGTAVSEGANDRRGTDMTVIVTGDGTGRSVYVNGVLVAAFGAPTGGPDGTGGGLGLGGFNNNGTPSTWAAGRIYGVLAENRRLTPGEVANAHTKLRRTYT